MTNQSLFRAPYVINSFLHQFGELALSRQGNLIELCDLAGLPREALAEQDRLIPFDRFIKLLETTEAELQFPAIALAMAQRQDISILGPLSTMLYECKTIRDALEVILKYLQIIVSGIEIKMIEQENLVQIEFHCFLPDLCHRPQFQNYLLASTTKILKEIVGKECILRGCFFVQPEPQREQIKNLFDYFGCPVAFNAKQLRLTFSSTLMNSTFDGTKETVTEKINAIVKSKGDIANQVSKAISLCLPSGKTDMETVAKSMGYSKRTLHRQLVSSSTSYRALLDSVRLSHANQYLKSTHYSLSDIAILLGYNNLSAFTRSYQRWCGVSPSDIRKNTKK